MSQRTLFTAHQWSPPLHSTRLSTLVLLLAFWPRLAYLERLLQLARLGRWSSLPLLGGTLFFVIIVLVIFARRWLIFALSDAFDRCLRCSYSRVEVLRDFSKFADAMRNSFGGAF
jgi:hypothetical protein